MHIVLPTDPSTFLADILNYWNMYSKLIIIFVERRIHLFPYKIAMLRACRPHVQQL